MTSIATLQQTTSPSPKVRAAKPHWPELDVLRGLAAVLMVYNHAGVRFPREAHHWLGNALEFAGSLAPVVFFLVTGLGRGVQFAAGGSARPLSDTLRKVLLLLLADVALWLSPAQHLGMDFLGFIAVSTLVVELIARTRLPTAIAWLVFFGVLGMRLLGAPLRESLGDNWLTFLCGLTPRSGFSYPLAPWLAYPVLGFLLGAAAQRRAATLRAAPDKLLLGALLATAAFGAVSLWQHSRGAMFFRWGSVSVAFTILSFATIFASIAAALVLAKTSLTTRAFALPGTSSLVIVPVHYCLIDALVRIEPALATGANFPLTATILVAVALVLARLIDRAIGVALAPRANLWWPLFAAALALLAATYATHGTAARLPCMAAAQLALCALFAMRGRSPTPR